MTAQKEELQQQLLVASDKAEKLTVQLQKQKDAHSELESQLGKQTAEVCLVRKRASNLDGSNRELQRKLDTILLDQQQMQSQRDREKAAANKLLSAVKAELHELQVTAKNLTHAGSICTW